jgi:hypothetical protein
VLWSFRDRFLSDFLVAAVTGARYQAVELRVFGWWQKPLWLALRIGLKKKIGKAGIFHV